MKILNKKGTSNSSADSGLTAEKLVVILVIVALIFILIPSVVTAGALAFVKSAKTCSSRLISEK